MKSKIQARELDPIFKDEGAFPDTEMFIHLYLTFYQTTDI